MRRNRSSWLFLALLQACTSFAQVVGPAEIKDPDLRVLQQQYMDDLQSAGREILADHFDYPFYLSRKLGLDQLEQKRADQRSIRFDRYNGHTVVAVTGNYYAAYSSEKISEDQRARSTFLDVVVPVLKAIVPRFQSNRDIQGYAVEVSHHILGKVMNVSMERSENLMVYLPQKAAIRLIGGQDDAVKQAALLEGKTFLNAVPITIWLSGEGPQLPDAASTKDTTADEENSARKLGEEIVSTDRGESRSNSSAVTFANLKPKEKIAPAPPSRDTSPAALVALQTGNQEPIDRMLKELDAQAHFVSCAPPKFVAFRQGIYLEISMNTQLAESAAGSRYKLAALAFDEHIAKLVRPASDYFKGDQNFDGLGFSTTVHLAGKAVASANSEAVEFFFPLSSLRCYASYECTGQQLIDSGTVLINGERVALDLQIAEGGAAR